MCIVSVIYTLVNVAYMSVLGVQEMLQSQAVAVVCIMSDILL